MPCSDDRALAPRMAAAAAATAVLTALMTLAAPPALANVMHAEQLNVYRDGTSADWLLGNNRLLGDGFDNGDPLMGPLYAGSSTFAAYALLGAASPAAASEQGSQLRLDPNLGTLSANAQGQIGTSVRLRLLTNTSTPGAGLHVSRSFATTLRLSLAEAPDPGQSFGLRLSDGGLSATSNDVVELIWSGGAGAGNVVFRKQDFEAGTITVLGSASVLAPVGAQMLVLSLAHGTPGSSAISGSYSFADGNGQLLGSFTGFATTATAFQGEDFTRVELRATGLSVPVPEPGTWALMAGGLAALLSWRRGPGPRARQGAG